MPGHFFIPIPGRTATLSAMLAAYLQLPRVIYVLCLGTFINRAGSLLVPFLTIYAKKELGEGVAFATLTMGAFGLGSVLGQTVGGHLADHIGRRWVMLLALFGGPAIMASLALVSSAKIFLLGVFTLAIFSEMLRPAVQAMMADVVPPAQRPHAFSMMYVSINLGFAIGPMIGGLLAEHSFRLIFFGDAATTCLYGMIVLVFIPESKPFARARQEGEIREHDNLTFVQALRRIASDRIFVALCGASFLIAIVFMQSMSTFPLYLEQLGFGPSTYGKIIAVNGWLIVLLQVPMTAWLSRFRRAPRLVTAALLTGIGIGMQGLAGAPWTFALAVATWTIGEIIQAPLLGPIIADLAPTEMRGRYMGVFGMSFSGANMLGAPLGGKVLEHFGARPVWTACVILALAAAAIYAQLGRRIEAKSG
jgi:MFS family permease